MIRNYSKSALQKKSILIAFLIIYSFCLFENAFSLTNWDRNRVSVSYDNKKNAILIEFVFIDYEFGDLGEHAYLEKMELCYLKSETEYDKLMICEVENQLKTGMSAISLKSKLRGANIYFGSSDQTDDSKWLGTEEYVMVNDISSKGRLTIVWYLASQQIVKSILVKAKWQIKGLRCCEDITQVYNVPYESLSQKISEQKYINDKFENQSENNNLIVYKQADNVVIKGAHLGENIKVYSTTGSLINTTTATDDVVKIILSSNQIYFVQIGQSCYKVAL